MIDDIYSFIRFKLILETLIMSIATLIIGYWATKENTNINFDVGILIAIATAFILSQVMRSSLGLLFPPTWSNRFIAGAIWGSISAIGISIILGWNIPSERWGILDWLLRLWPTLAIGVGLSEMFSPPLPKKR